MEKILKIAGWGIFGILTLVMGFLLIARYNPALMVKIIGSNGRPGQLAKICKCSGNTLMIEEIIDNDSGIGVEGGAGFSVQLKKLLLVDIDKMEIQTTGLPINTTVIGCSEEIMWVFDQKRGILGLSAENGKELVDQEKILKLNPVLSGRLSRTSQDFSLDEEKHQLLLEDVQGAYWQLDKDFVAQRQRSYPPSTNQRLNSPANRDLQMPSLFYPTLLIETADSKLLILHYKNKLREGLRLSLMNKAGQTLWQQNLDHLLDREQEQCRPAATYQTGNQVLLLLDTSRGSRLIWLDGKNGKCLKNKRV